MIEKTAARIDWDRRHLVKELRRQSPDHPHAERPGSTDGLDSEQLAMREAADTIEALMAEAKNVGFRLAPSPVQGADDRLAAEAVIAEIQHLWRTQKPEVFHVRVRQVIAAYQQSPQAALNEVRAGALEEAADAVDTEAPDEPWAGASFESHATWLRDSAAELRAAPQTK